MVLQTVTEDNVIKKYRSRDEIIEAYLAPLEQRSMSKTEMMNSAKSFQNQYQRYYPVLAGLGFIEYNKEAHLVKITEKGRKFLHLRREQKKLLNE